MKDWIGDKHSTYAQLGASSHCVTERALNDYYATDPVAVDKLFGLLGVDYFQERVWETACGEGHLSKRMSEFGKMVKSTDLVERGYGEGEVDFLEVKETWDGDIITNPPYSLALEFVLKGLEVLGEGGKLAMFLKIQFLESKKRKAMLLENPPKYVCVFSERMLCVKNGDFAGAGSSAVCYAWFVWEKGYKGETIIKII